MVKYDVTTFIFIPFITNHVFIISLVVVFYLLSSPMVYILLVKEQYKSWVCMDLYKDAMVQSFIRLIDIHLLFQIQILMSCFQSIRVLFYNQHHFLIVS